MPPPLRGVKRKMRLHQANDRREQNGWWRYNSRVTDRILNHDFYGELYEALKLAQLLKNIVKFHFPRVRRPLQLSEKPQNSNVQIMILIYLIKINLLCYKLYIIILISKNILNTLKNKKWEKKKEGRGERERERERERIFFRDFKKKLYINNNNNNFIECS